MDQSIWDTLKIINLMGSVLSSIAMVKNIKDRLKMGIGMEMALTFIVIIQSIMGSLYVIAEKDKECLNIIIRKNMRAIGKMI